MNRRDIFGFGTLLLLVISGCRTPPPIAPAPPPDDDPARLPAKDEAAERAWLTSLGISLPNGRLLLAFPFAEPLGPRSYVVPTDWYRHPPGSDVAADELRADLPILHRAMESAYGGWTTAQSRGWQWDDWFARWDGALAAKTTARISREEAFFPWQRLMEFQLDNHSGPTQGPRWNSGSRSAVLSSDPASPCLEMTTEKGTFPLDPGDPSQRPRRARLFDPATRAMTQVSYLSYPARRGELSAVRCGGALTPATPTWNGSWRERAKNACDLNHTSNDEPGFRVIEPGFAYLRLPTFSRAHRDRLEALATRLPATLEDLRVLIVDLRTNDGGDAPVDLLLSRWIPAPLLSAITRSNHELRSSCLYSALRWGYAQSTSLELKAPLSPGVERILEHALVESMAPVAAGCPVKVVTERASLSFAQHQPPAKPPEKGPIFLVVTDNLCGSDCEYMVSTLAKLPQTVVAGANTYGVAEFIQPGYFVLPHSRTPFRIALGHSDQYGDGRSFDGYGLDVDILLPTREANGAEGVLSLAHALAGAPASRP
jgi:hypothetical protein